MIMATIIPSIITGIVAIVVCLLNNHYAREKDPRQSGQNIFPQYALSVLQKAWMQGNGCLQ